VKYPNQQQVPSIPPQPRGRQPAATAAIAVAASSRPSPFDPSPRTIHKPQSPPEECFWDVDSCTFDVGLWFDEKSAKKLQNIPKNSLQQQQQQQPQFSSHSLYSDGGNSSFHEGSIGYLGPLPTATPSPPMILSRSNKMSRENSSDYGEGSQMNREKYRESLHHQQHYQSDYSDPDQYDYDATHQHTQPNKIQKVSTTQLYHKPCHGENTSHHHLSSLDDGYYRDTENESDAGSVAGYSSATSGYYLDRTISNCRISDGTAATATTTTGNSFSKIPIQHSFSCNNLPGPGIQRSSSFPSSHDNGVVHSSSSTNTVNSFHIGGHSGQLHHSPRTILTSQEFKQANHHIQSSLATQQQQLHQHNSFPTQQQLHHQQTTHLSPSSITTGSTLISFHQPLQILRFTRISNHVWVLNIDKVYQIESFLQRYFSCVMYLLDEKMIPTEEWTNRKLESLDQDQTINGINDLQVELELRKMFVTSWPPQLHDQLLGFVNNWNSLLQQHAEERKQQQQQQQQQRLRDEATTSSSSSAIGCDPHDPPTLLSLWDSGPISLMSRSSNPSSGILAYEISLQHGLVIRSDSTNDENTMWSLIYLHDLLHPSPMPTTSPATWTCYDIFCRIFPQFSAFISHLTEGRDDIANIGIKYCTHSMNSSTTASASATSTGFSFTGFSSSSSSAMAQEGNSSPTPSSPRQDHHRAAPPSPNSSAYQTIGVLSDPASKLIARSVSSSSSSSSHSSSDLTSPSDSKERSHSSTTSSSSQLVRPRRLSLQPLLNSTYHFFFLRSQRYPFKSSSSSLLMTGIHRRITSSLVSLLRRLLHFQAAAMTHDTWQTLFMNKSTIYLSSSSLPPLLSSPLLSSLLLLFLPSSTHCHSHLSCLLSLMFSVSLLIILSAIESLSPLSAIRLSFPICPADIRNDDHL
jgi:hypothetical protein